MTTFTGCGTALVTPFRKDQSLDEETLRKLVRRQIQARHRFPGSVRHYRRKPDPDPRRTSARGRNHARRKPKARFPCWRAPADTTPPK